MEITINKLTSRDTKLFSDLIRIFGTVFETSEQCIPGESYLESLLEKQDFLVLIAEYEGQVVGGLTVYLLQSYYSEKAVAYIYDVGVMTAYQRKGIGNKLISYLKAYCAENGIEEAYVEAETEDVEAIEFYRATSPDIELQATHFTYLVNHESRIENRE